MGSRLNIEETDSQIVELKLHIQEIINSLKQVYNPDFKINKNMDVHIVIKVIY